mgnify:CR=1 FL=1
MPIRLFGKTLREYLETGRLPAEIRPPYCERCGASGRFHRHHSYPRKNVFLNGAWLLAVLYIQRFKCCECGAVFSLIPLFLFKNQQTGLHDQQAALDDNTSPAAKAFHPRTVTRWKQRFKEAASKHQQLLVRIILSLKADLTVDASADEASDAFTYLNFLIHQLPKDLPILLEFLALIRYGGGFLRKAPQNLSDSHRKVVWV